MSTLYAWIKGEEDEKPQFCLSRFQKSNPNFPAKVFDSKEDLEAEVQKRRCEVVWQQ